MIIFSRHRDKSIMIGDSVKVTIVDIRGDSVRIGTEAPREIPVHRQEVYEAIQSTNKEVADNNPTKVSEKAQPNYSAYFNKNAKDCNLVLSRRLNESIMIGDDIVVKVVGIRGNTVRLGINAPQDIPVHRQEVYDNIQEDDRHNTTENGQPNPPTH